MKKLSKLARRSRRLGTGTLVLVVTALALAAGVSASSSNVQRAEADAAFRTAFLSYLNEMQEVAVILRKTPRGRSAAARLGVNPTAGIARSREGVKQMTPEQLAALRQAFATAPDWQSHPRVLKAALRRQGIPPSRAAKPLAVGPDCDPGPGTPLGITDFYIAAGVALALEVTHEAIPDDILTSIAQVAAATAWGIAATAALTLEGLNAVEAECLAAKFEALVESRLDVAVSTRATQTSVDTSTATLNALSALVNSRLDVAVSTRATQASLTAFNNQFTAFNTEFQTFHNEFNTFNTAFNTFHDEFTANATTVNNKLDGITTSLTSAHQKIDQLTINVGDQGELALRMQIEADLSDPANHPVALFALPAANGGYLNVTRDIVADTIANTLASGQGVGNAAADLAQGNALAAAGDYKAAYREYGKAYRAAATR
jgi:hypothetical protein